MTTPAPARAEVWDIDFDPTIGHEQAGTRPGLVISVDAFNNGPADLFVAARMTRTNRHIRWHVRVASPEGGLASESFILCESVRPVSKGRLKRRRGKVSEVTMLEVEDRFRILLGL
jgi:mRNA interferase MazF